MATDNTEPKTGFIFQLGIFSIVAIIAARYLLVSYFNVEMRKEYEDKIGSHKNATLSTLRAEAQKALTSGPVPIDKAMRTFATRPRQELTAIAPKPSEDLAPVIGWTLSPQPAPPPVVPAADPAATPDAVAPGAVSQDAQNALAPGGAAIADGGAPAQGAGIQGDAGSANRASANGSPTAPPKGAQSGSPRPVTPASSAPTSTP